jgi:bifunctional N-acetylglucosamine-1-phosphate-uridyltransferase/glucosamine-1-phosphate-acetyltransferase GlmU-like protein
LYSEATYRKAIEEVANNGLTLGFGVVKSTARFSSYGRVTRDEDGKVKAVVEVPEATEEELKISERSINLFVVDNKWLFKILPKIKQSAVKGEYYIVDIVKFAIDEGQKVETIEIENEDEALGINTPEDREETEKILRSRQNS